MSNPAESPAAQPDPATFGGIVARSKGLPTAEQRNAIRQRLLDLEETYRELMSCSVNLEGLTEAKAFELLDNLRTAAFAMRDIMLVSRAVGIRVQVIG